MGPDALADWHTDTHFLFAAHNLPNEACHSPSPPFNSSLADCHFVRFMDVRRDKDPSHPAHYYCNSDDNSWWLYWSE